MKNGTEANPVILGKDIPAKMQEYSDHVRTCIMRGCLGRGYYEPTLGLSYDGATYAHMAFPGWLMCDFHHNQVGLEDLVDGQVEGKGGVTAFELIQNSFKKHDKKAPDRQYTTLSWKDA